MTAIYVRPTVGGVLAWDAKAIEKLNETPDPKPAPNPAFRKAFREAERAVRAEAKAKAAARNAGLEPESLVLCGSDGVPLEPTFSPFGPLVLAPTKLSGLLSYSIKTRPMWQFFMAPKAKR